MRRVYYQGRREYSPNRAEAFRAIDLWYLAVEGSDVTNMAQPNIVC